MTAFLLLAKVAGYVLIGMAFAVLVVALAVPCAVYITLSNWGDR